MIPGKKYDPGTFTSRRPTPEKFDHLREWIEPVERNIQITNITEMTNINQQLEQTANLFVSNIINRVIAQLIGKHGDGFVTIEATAAGALKVAAMGSGRTILQADIDFATGAHNTIVAAVSGKKIKVTNLVLTVAGEVNLTFESHETALSGAMDFGGTDEPRGLAMPFGDFPLETVAGEAFKILSVGDVQVSGYCNYFTE